MGCNQDAMGLSADEVTNKGDIIVGCWSSSCEYWLPFQTRTSIYWYPQELGADDCCVNDSMWLCMCHVKKIAFRKKKFINSALCKKKKLTWEIRSPEKKTGWTFYKHMLWLITGNLSRVVNGNMEINCRLSVW